MRTAAVDARNALTRAGQARQGGRTGEALAVLQGLVAEMPDYAPAWNMLGIVQLEEGQPDKALESLKCAVEADPEQPLPWLNLSKAQRALGDYAAELQSLEASLSRDPYLLPAILAKGEVLLLLDRRDEAVELYRLLFSGLDEKMSVPEPIAGQLEAARVLLRTHGEQQFRHFSQVVAEVAEKFPEADLERAKAFVEHQAGKRRIYVQQPTAFHFPYLPAVEFFDREQFAWFKELERHTAEMREELLSLWTEEGAEFRPYVAYAPGAPVNQWAELNHSPRWSAWFFWENGIRNDANCARCPRTAAAIEQAPMLDIPGKAPTAMFSVLKPRTRIPPHTGSANARTTVHLPLVVPPGCGFRVGAVTREWREGECWAFDDTIEHEAWNDSDKPRAILIVDCWNPLLTEAERAVVRALG